MNRIFITAAAALAAAAVMVQAVPAEANSRDREIAIGLIGATAGFIVGNATAGGITVHRPAPPAWHDDRYRGPRYDRRYDPRYDRRHWRPAPQPAPRPELRRAGDPWSATWLRYCRETYRSFNERTGTFRGFDGRDHFCVMPEHLKPRGRFD